MHHRPRGRGLALEDARDILGAHDRRDRDRQADALARTRYRDRAARHLADDAALDLGCLDLGDPQIDLLAGDADLVLLVDAPQAARDLPLHRAREVAEIGLDGHRDERRLGRNRDRIVGARRAALVAPAAAACQQHQPGDRERAGGDAHQLLATTMPSMRKVGTLTP